MPRPSSPPGWRGILLLLNAGLPLPTLVLLATGHPFGPWFLLLTLGSHGLLLWGIMFPRCSWLGPLISSFKGVGEEVWLTIDDGPDGERTRELAEGLRARGVKATFFVIGEKLRQQREIARLLQQEGHTIANHTLAHPRRSFWCSSHSQISAEVDGGCSELRALDLESAWFRPPVGHKPPGLRRVLQDRGMHLVSWTVGGRDGWNQDIRGTIGRVLAKAKPGAIIVLHEARAHSVATILGVVDALLEKGYTFVIPSAEQLGIRSGEIREGSLAAS